MSDSLLEKCLKWFINHQNSWRLIIFQTCGWISWLSTLRFQIILMFLVKQTSWKCSFLFQGRKNRIRNKLESWKKKSDIETESTLLRNVPSQKGSNANLKANSRVSVITGVELSHWECFPGGVAAGDAGSPPRPPWSGSTAPSSGGHRAAFQCHRPLRVL